jgi:hypothetical protein
MNESYTAVVARNDDWIGDWASEPYETAWASEAIFFVRVLKAQGEATTVSARVQMSPDGMHWVDEGSRLEIPAREGICAVKVSHFGGWLRLTGRTPEGSSLRVMAYLALKG